MNCKKIVSFFSTAVMVLSSAFSSWGGVNFAPTACAVEASTAYLLEPGVYIAPLYQCRTAGGLDSLLDNEYQHFNGRAKLEVTEDGRQIVTIGVENWDFYEAFVPMNQEYNILFGDEYSKNSETAQYICFRDAFPEKLLTQLSENGNKEAESFMQTSEYCTSKVNDFFKYGNIKYGDITVDTDTNHSSDTAYVSFEINDYREEFYVAAWANRPGGDDGYEASRQFVLNYADMYKADVLEQAIESNNVGFRMMVPSSMSKTATYNPVMYVANNTTSKIFDSVSTKVITDEQNNKKVIATYHVSDSYPKTDNFVKLCGVSETEVTDSSAWSLYSRAITDPLTLSEERNLTIEYEYNSIDDLIFGEYIYFEDKTNAFTKRNVCYGQPVLAPIDETCELVDETTGVKVSFKTSQVQTPENISLKVESKPIDDTTKSIVEYGYTNDTSNWYKIELIDTSTGNCANFVGGINVQIPLPENMTSENRNNYITKLLTTYGEIDSNPVLDYESEYWLDNNEVYADGTLYYFIMNLAENDTERIKNLSDGIYSAEAFLFKSGPTVPTYSMANGALNHKVYIVVENGKERMYFKAQDMSGKGHLGHIMCNDDEAGSAYYDSISYTKFDTLENGELITNSGYDPIAEWGCVEGGILTLIDDSYELDNLNMPCYRVAIGAPPMAAMGGQLYSDIAVDDLGAKLEFFNVEYVAEFTEDNIEAYITNNGYGYDISALTRQVRLAEIKMAEISSYTAESAEALETAYNAAVAAVSDGEGNYDPLNTNNVSSDVIEQHCLALEAANKNVTSISIDGYSASIEENINFNFCFSLNENLSDLASDGNLTATVTNPDGSTETVNVVEATNGYSVTVEVAPKELANDISVTIGDYTFTYSVQEYLEALITNENATDKQKAIAKSLLNYGGYAQDYFVAKNAEVNGYVDTDRANANLTDDEKSLATVTPVVSAFVAPTIGENVSYYGASVTFDNELAAKLYFKVTDDVANHTFNVNGETVTPVDAQNGYYYVAVSGITAPNIGTAYPVTVDEASFNYSIHNYIYSALNATEVSSGKLIELQNLVKSLYLYGEACKTS